MPSLLPAFRPPLPWPVSGAVIGAIVLIVAVFVIGGVVLHPRGAAGGGEPLAAGCGVTAVARIRRSPSSSPTCASHPSASRARVTSRQLRRHLAGPRRGELGLDRVAPAPLTRTSVSSTSSTGISRPVPMFTGPVTSASPAMRLARATSLTSTQSRVWLPSPKTVGRRPATTPPAEDRHHAGLAVHVLARAVHVAVAQRDRGQAVQPGVELAIALGGVLSLAVRGKRPDRVVLRGRDAPRRRRKAPRRSRCSRRGGHRPRAPPPAR